MRVESTRRSDTAVQSAPSIYKSSHQIWILPGQNATLQLLFLPTLYCKNTSEPYTLRNVPIALLSAELHESFGAILR